MYDRRCIFLAESPERVKVQKEAIGKGKMISLEGLKVVKIRKQAIEVDPIADEA